MHIAPGLPLIYTVIGIASGVRDEGEGRGDAAAGGLSAPRRPMESSSRLLVAGAATAVAAAVAAAALLAPTWPAESEETPPPPGGATAAAEQKDAHPGSVASTRARASLADELRCLRLRPLLAKAAEAGVAEKSVEEALDGESPKEELVELLLVAAHAAHEEPPAGRAGLAALPATLERALGELERAAIASPRRDRRAIRAVVDRAEAALDTMGTDGWSDAVARCGSDDLERLAAATAALNEIGGTTGATEVAARI